jgi:hypothetical protein
VVRIDIGKNSFHVVGHDKRECDRGAAEVVACMRQRWARPRTVRPLVSLTLVRDEVPVVLALRLFLPESWTSKRSRLERAGVPAECRTARTKPEMALAEIDRAIAAFCHRFTHGPHHVLN